MLRRSLLFACLVLLAAPVAGQSYELELSDVVLRGVAFAVKATPSEGAVDAASAARLRVRIGDATSALTADDGAFIADVQVDRTGPMTVELLQDDTVVAEGTIRAMPAWLSIAPPLLAIAIALLFRRVIPALFVGLWGGAWIALGFPGIGAGWAGLLDSFQVYVRGALVDGDRISIILFTFMIGGMVGVIARCGGTQGVVNHVVRWASDSRRGQLGTAVLGLVVFFDDYANTLVVGNTMRPVTDRLRISREKLAYIVDSTAAPVACIAFVTTWIGYEIGLIEAAVDKIDDYDAKSYDIFIDSLAYSFYPVLAIFFVFAVVWTRRDFGAMHAAETRARQIDPSTDADIADLKGASALDASGLSSKKGVTPRAINAILPVLVLVVGVLVGLVVTGTDDDPNTEQTLREVIGDADSYAALMWASLLAVLAAMVLAIGQQLLSLEEAVEAWYSGVRTMLFAMIILVLAWSLSDVTEVLHTADYLVSVLGDTLPVGIVPALVFLISAATAFATGSSWGTMGILMPLVVPLVWAVLDANSAASPENYHVIYSTVACVLAGSVWGDHCSPISDTTILSSMASGCDHVEHVRTQIPYALTVGAVALGAGTIPTGFGFPWWMSFLIGMAILGLVLRTFGRAVDEPQV